MLSITNLTSFKNRDTVKLQRILTCPLTLYTVDVMMISSLTPMNFVESFCTEMTRRSRNGFVSSSLSCLMCVFYETPVKKLSDHEQQMEQS